VNGPLPTVSVILPTFNRLQYLPPAVDSVFTQTFADWELIIADDGSDAETVSYLRKLAGAPRVRFLGLPHTGNPSVVRNRALREARGDYVAFIDSDDVWLPQKLEIQIARQRSSNCRWSYTGLSRVDDNGEPLPGDLPARRLICEGSILSQLLTLQVAVATPSVLAERSLLDEVGGFDEQQLFFEEYDLWLRLNLRSEVCAVSQPLVLVRNHNQHYSADRVGVYQARFRLLDKIAGLTTGMHLESVIRHERAKTAAALASVHAAAGRRVEALQMLWQSRRGAWQTRGWWSKAAATAGRAIMPVRLRALLRDLRNYKRRRNRPPVGGRA
jgi:glycosyltransferase involved in cell wall biosynthesis